MFRPFQLSAWLLIKTLMEMKMTKNKKLVARMHLVRWVGDFWILTLGFGVSVLSVTPLSRAYCYGRKLLISPTKSPSFFFTRMISIESSHQFCAGLAGREGVTSKFNLFIGSAVTESAPLPIYNLEFVHYSCWLKRS